MKTMDVIFTVIFALIAVTALVATFCGHTHQLAIFGISATMATASYIDNKKQQHKQ